MAIYYYNPYEEQYRMYRFTMQQVMTAAMTMANQKMREKEMDIRLKHDESMAKRQEQAAFIRAGYKPLAQTKAEYFEEPRGWTNVTEGPFGTIYQDPEAEAITVGDKTIGYKYGKQVIKADEMDKEPFFFPHELGDISLKDVEGQFDVGFFKLGDQPPGAIPYSAGAMGKAEKTWETYVAKKGNELNLPPGTLYQVGPKDQIKVVREEDKNKVAFKSIMATAAAAGVSLEKFKYPIGHPKGLNKEDAVKIHTELQKERKHWLLEFMQMMPTRGGGI